ncbi:MAG: F0F1 ATP synthase subunit epsilon [Nitrospirota bacterium]
MASFSLTIVTPVQIFFQGEVESLVAPGTAGSFGVLMNHAPLIATLDAGVFKMKTSEGEKSYKIGPGFFDVLQNQATLLTTAIEPISS